MVSFGQKLKMPKRCEKPFYKNNRVVLCEKLLKKKTTIREIRPRRVRKIGHPAKAIAHAKAIAFGKWSVCLVKLKYLKDAKRFVVCKKPFEKTPTQYSRNDTILKISHLVKATSRA